MVQIDLFHKNRTYFTGTFLLDSPLRHLVSTADDVIIVFTHLYDVTMGGILVRFTVLVSIFSLIPNSNRTDCASGDTNKCTG